MLPPTEAWSILNTAEQVCASAEVTAAVERIANAITRTLADRNPLLLGVMRGAVVFGGHLLPRLRFPLDFDYLDLTRYGDATRGGRLEWRVWPRQPVKDRVVLVIDDILDEGQTLAAIRDRVRAEGASAFYSAVLVDKRIAKPKPIAADFVGVTLPNRYLFGFGMDVKGAWRNLPAIYALKDSEG